MAILIGFEAANSYVKVHSSILEELNRGVMTYLNTYSRVEDIESAYTDGKNRKLKSGFYKFGDEIYQVGMQKKTSDVQSSSGKSGNRYSLPEFQLEALIGIYKQLELAQGDVFDEDIYVVTGVPVNHYVKENVKIIKEQLEKKHVVCGREFTIKEVKVVKQGLATYYDLLLDKKGTLNEQFTAAVQDQDILVIDIGHRSTDVVWIKSLVPGLTLGAKGMGFAYDEILKRSTNKDLKSEAHIDSLSIAPSLQKGSVNKKYVIQVGVIKDTEIDEAVKEEFKKLAMEIIKSIVAKYDWKVFEKIVFCGGGSIGLKHYLLESIKEQNIATEYDAERFIWVAEAQTSNASGYLKYAKFFFQKQGVEV